jgi:hypothetical protein
MLKLSKYSDLSVLIHDWSEWLSVMSFNTTSRKEVKPMHQKRRQPYWAKSSRLAAAVRSIRAVRHERGLEAHGDALLRLAVKAVDVGDPGSALSALETFLQHVPNLQPEHRSLLASACSQLRLARRRLLSILRPVVTITTLVVEMWLKLTNRHPMNSFATFPATNVRHRYDSQWTHDRASRSFALSL